MTLKGEILRLKWSDMSFLFFLIGDALAGWLAGLIWKGSDGNKKKWLSVIFQITDNHLFD